MLNAGRLKPKHPTRLTKPDGDRLNSTAHGPGGENGKPNLFTERGCAVTKKITWALFWLAVIPWVIELVSCIIQKV